MLFFNAWCMAHENRFNIHCCLINLFLFSIGYCETINRSDLNATRIISLIFIICSFRCRIPNCDGQNGTSAYNSVWLQNAIPFKNNRPEKCLRYGQSQTLSNDSSGFCPKLLFNETVTIKCDQFIFKTDEHRIMKEVSSHKLKCDFFLGFE